MRGTRGSDARRCSGILCTSRANRKGDEFRLRLDPVVATRPATCDDHLTRLLDNTSAILGLSVGILGDTASWLNAEYSILRLSAASISVCYIHTV
jgi:hypothetical protein